MTDPNDPGLWHTFANWLWAVLLLPIATVWRKVDGSASREELANVQKENRETFKQLFEKAEESRDNLFKGLAAIRKEMSDMHVDLVDRIDAKKDRT